VVAVDGLVLSGSARSELLLVPCRTTTGRLGLLETPTGALECTPVAGFDETLRLVRVRGRAADAAAPLTPIGPWGAATAAARRALAHELIGLARQMLDDAARHVTDREQFGRPIAVFQAVRHRLADGHVAVVSSRAVLDDAWTAGDQAALAADAAKALAGRAALAAGRHCLQVTGAIGFTWEHDLHRRIRRVHLLDGLYGASDGLAAAIGAGLLAGGGPVPRIGGGEL
jgi:alkylation response protein AidB-like acyl-CoA dehydrogenase